MRRLCKASFTLCESERRNAFKDGRLEEACKNIFSFFFKWIPPVLYSDLWNLSKKKKNPFHFYVNKGKVLHPISETVFSSTFESVLLRYICILNSFRYILFFNLKSMNFYFQFENASVEGKDMLKSCYKCCFLFSYMVKNERISIVYCKVHK